MKIKLKYSNQSIKFFYDLIFGVRGRGEEGGGRAMELGSKFQIRLQVLRCFSPLLYMFVFEINNVISFLLLIYIVSIRRYNY